MGATTMSCWINNKVFGSGGGGGGVHIRRPPSSQCALVGLQGAAAKIRTLLKFRVQGHFATSWLKPSHKPSIIALSRRCTGVAM